MGLDGMGEPMNTGLGMVSMGRGMDGNVAGGRVGRNVFLLILVLVNLIRGGSRLAVHNCVGFGMGFVDGGSYSRSIALFETLMAMLISHSQSQESCESNKSLKK